MSVGYDIWYLSETDDSTIFKIKIVVLQTVNI